MNNKKLFGVLAVAVVVVAVAIGIVVATSGKQDNGMDHMNMSAPSNATATSSVTIQNYAFSPSAIKVKAGTTVTWTNQDAVNHTVTADTNTTDAPSSMDIARGKSYSFTFKKAGTYTYHCNPHPYMHGTVEVTN